MFIKLKAFENNQVVIISGQAGTGKTKLVQHLFRMSSIYQNTYNTTPSTNQQAASPSTLKTSIYYTTSGGGHQAGATASSSSSFDAHLPQHSPSTNNNNNNNTHSPNNNYVNSSTVSIMSAGSSSSGLGGTNHATNIQVKYLASNLAGVHVCLREDRRTREPGQFLHNLAWSLTHFDCLHKIVVCPKQTASSNTDRFVLYLS